MAVSSPLTPSGNLSVKYDCSSGNGKSCSLDSSLGGEGSRAYGEPSQFKFDGTIADVLHEHKPAFVYGEQPLSFPSSSKPLFTTTLTF